MKTSTMESPTANQKPVDASRAETTESAMGIVANVLAVGFFVPAIGVFLSLISVVGLLIWYVLIARGLFMLAQSVPNEEAH